MWACVGAQGVASCLFGMPTSASAARPTYVWVWDQNLGDLVYELLGDEHLEWQSVFDNHRFDNPVVEVVEYLQEFNDL